MTLRHFMLSLAAVFGALAVGVVLGARVLSAPLSTGSDGGREPKQQAGTLAEQNTALTEKLSAAAHFDSLVSGRVVHDALAGKSVVIFRTPDAEDADVDAIAGLVSRAGGSLAGTVGLTEEFIDGNSAEKLRSVVVSPIVPAGTGLSTTLTDAGAQAGDLLGIALLINRDPAITPVDDAARKTVLDALRDTGFITCPDSIAAADTALVLTGDALAADAGTRAATAAQFAAALSPHGSGTVLAGRDGTPGAVSAVAVARADPGLSGAVTTVDGIGAPAGRITAVLALRALLDGAAPEKYGTAAGVTAVTVGP